VARSQAEATTEALSERATQVHEPSTGALEPPGGNEVACDDSRVTAHNFIAEARFYNPSAPDQAWDYGFIFLNVGTETDYRLTVDSGGSWALNLHSPGFDITNRDETTLLDLGEGGSNRLKLVVSGDTAYLFINGQYATALDMDLYEMVGPERALHPVLICAGINSGFAALGRTTRYEDFTVWELP
jgi:hypothetical protein